MTLPENMPQEYIVDNHLVLQASNNHITIFNETGKLVYHLQAQQQLNSEDLQYVYYNVYKKNQQHTPAPPTLFGIEKGIICQQVNCCGVMEAGLAKVISEQYPQVKLAYEEIYQIYKKGDTKCCINLFGASQLIPLQYPYTPVKAPHYNEQINNCTLFVANIYSQAKYGNPAVTGEIYTDVKKLSNAIKRISEQHPDLAIYIPEGIGCGLGGELWENVEIALKALKLPNLYCINTRHYCFRPLKEDCEKTPEIGNNLDID